MRVYTFYLSLVRVFPKKKWQGKSYVKMHRLLQSQLNQWEHQKTNLFILKIILFRVNILSLINMQDIALQ